MGDQRKLQSSTGSMVHIFLYVHIMLFTVVGSFLLRVSRFELSSGFHGQPEFDSFEVVQVAVMTPGHYSHVHI